MADTTVTTLNEHRGVACLLSFKTAAKMSNWREVVERRLLRTLERDGCPPETVTFDEPFQASDEAGLPLPAWEVRAYGMREHR